MYKLQVTMSDTNSSAQFDIASDSVKPDYLRKVLIDMHDEWKDMLSRQGSGSVRVAYKGTRVAHGILRWNEDGTYAIALH